MKKIVYFSLWLAILMSQESFAKVPKRCGLMGVSIYELVATGIPKMERKNLPICFEKAEAFQRLIISTPKYTFTTIGSIEYDQNDAFGGFVIDTWGYRFSQILSANAKLLNLDNMNNIILTPIFESTLNFMIAPPFGENKTIQFKVWRTPEFWKYKPKEPFNILPSVNEVSYNAIGFSGDKKEWSISFYFVDYLPEEIE